MENSPYFSIIVPVFKVEQYLEKCVESVLEQVFTDFELLLVDDGSPDRCPVMCDELAMKDKRIRVIHKKNGGLSSARNAALRVAKGRYISFLDADDFWLNKFVLQSIYSAICERNAEIVVLKGINYYQSSNTFSDKYNTFLLDELEPDNYELNLYKLISASAYRANAWNKVFLRELTERQNLFFTEKVVAEDIDWAARLCLCAKSITILNDPVYGYRMGRPGSITSSLTIKNLIDTKENILRCLSYTKDRELSDLFQKSYYSYVAYRYVIWMAESSLVKDRRKRKLIKEMKSYVWLLNYDGIERVRKARLAYRILGFQGASMLLGIYLKGRKERGKRHGSSDHLHTVI